jgi:hypothetical protein
MLSSSVSGCEGMSRVKVLDVFKVLTRMKADEFCDRWFELNSAERESVKLARGYRANCVRSLSSVLKKPEKPVWYCVYSELSIVLGIVTQDACNFIAFVRLGYCEAACDSDEISFSGHFEASDCVAHTT